MLLGMPKEFAREKAIKFTIVPTVTGYEEYIGSSIS